MCARVFVAQARRGSSMPRIPGPPLYCLNKYKKMLSVFRSRVIVPDECVARKCLVQRPDYTHLLVVVLLPTCFFA